MHEYSLVRSLIGQVEEIVKEQGGGAVETIRLDVGIFSGVEIELLELAFQDLASSQFEHNVRLLVNRIPLSLRCRNCGSVTQTEAIHFQCEVCDSPFVKVINGDQIELVEIDVVEPAATEEPFG